MRCHILFTLVSCFIYASSVESFVQGSTRKETEWSTWIDKSHRSSVLSEDEVENLDQEELGRFCPYGVITEIECVPVERVDSLHKGSEQNITCDVQNGLVCLAKYNRPHGCLDYKIRYRCGRYPVKEVRKRQASLPGTNCNSWHPWINKNHPNSTNKNDYENLTASELLSFCPINNGAEVTKIECKDDRGEPFSGSFNNTANRYAGNCTNYREGLSCKMIDLNSAGRCPDFSFRFYCNCSVPVGSSMGTVIPGGTPATNRPSYSSSTVKPVTSGVTSRISPTTTTTALTSAFHISVRTSPITSNLPSKSHFKPTTTHTRVIRMSKSSVWSSASSKNRLTTERISVNTPTILSLGHKPVGSNTSSSTTSIPLISSRGSNKPGLTAMHSAINATTTGEQSNGEQQSDSFEKGSPLLWLILLIVCVSLCVFNLILLVFLHKRAMKHAKGQHRTKVRPLHD